MDPKNNKNKNEKPRGSLRGIVIIVVWAIVLTVVFNYINAYTRNDSNRSTSHEIKYSEMIQIVEEDKAKSVVFKDDAIYLTPVDGYVYTDGKGKEYTQSEKSGLTLYTVELNNPDLLPLLEAHNVEYTAPYVAEVSPVLIFMLNYILPIVLMVAFFMLIMRFISKSGGIGGISSVGKSNAKVYMERSTGVTFKDVAGQDEAKESLE
ncbi:MAG: ATP-dependent metallopeptidase FtsH/Yme1/Tma family protein, partial [Oscillospiraceae bacterium]|nr:ATP-dependent metallopeptidase FtsH/Yme1/Tma family protein [Oscillospiraceae bacterium]